MRRRHSRTLPAGVSHRFSPYTDCDSRITDRRGKAINEQILNIRLLIEKHRQYYKPLVLCFLEYNKDGSCIPWSKMVDILIRKGVTEKRATTIKELTRFSSIFGKDERVRNLLFRRNLVRKWQILSKSIFDMHTMSDLFETVREWAGGVEVYGDCLKAIRYADETTLVASNEEELAVLLRRLEEVTINHGVRINRFATKIMVVDRANVLKRCQELAIYERVNEIIYLGSIISSNGTCTKDIQRRIDLASRAMSVVQRQWKTLNIKSQEDRKKLVTDVVFRIFRYASETWTIRNQDRRNIDVFEMNCWRKVLDISRPCMKTNLSIRKKLKITKKLSTWCQLKAIGFFGHLVCDPDRHTVRALLLCNLSNPNEKRRKGRTPKRWESVVIQKTGCTDLRVAMRMAYDRERWRLLSHGERILM